MAAALPFVALAAAGVQAMGSVMQGQQQASADRYNAQVASQNAAATQEQTAASEQIQQEQAQRTIGSTVANYGASGVVSNTGTPLDVLANSASNAERDRQNILYKGQLQAAGYTDQAQLDSASASNAGPNSIMKASGILMQAGANTYDKISGAGSSPNYTGDGNGEF
jgi:hypothetical protein